MMSLLSRVGGVVVLVSLVGCRSDGSLQGTLVGNPGDASLTAAPSGGTTFRSARWTVDAVSWLPCGGGSPTVVDVGAEVDLLGVERLEAPEGFWCALAVTAAGPLALEVESAAGGTATLQLDVGVVEVASRGFASGEASPLVLEVGEVDWLDPAVLGYAGTEAVVVEPGLPLHDALAATAEAASALFADDGDLVVDAEERSTGEVAAGPARAESEDDDDEDDTGD